MISNFSLRKEAMIDGETVMGVFEIKREHGCLEITFKDHATKFEADLFLTAEDTRNFIKLLTASIDLEKV